MVMRYAGIWSGGSSHQYPSQRWSLPITFGPTIEAYSATRVAGGNRVDLLLNGDEIFPAILEAIGSAQSTITYPQYFYEEGEMPRQIAAALADRCRSGVRAHILLDGFGALLMPAEYREMMTGAGCEVTTFRPLNPLVLLSPFGLGRENNRSHRRILVVDGRLGFTGGRREPQVAGEWAEQGAVAADRCPDRGAGGRLPPGRFRRELARSDRERARRRGVLLAPERTRIGDRAGGPQLPRGGQLLDVHDVSARDVVGPTLDLHHESVLPARRIDPQTWGTRGVADRVLEMLSLPVRRDF
jgi:hypothetical protein